MPSATCSLNSPESKAAVMSRPPHMALCASAPSGYAVYQLLLTEVIICALKSSFGRYVSAASFFERYVSEASFFER